MVATLSERDGKALAVKQFLAGFTKPDNFLKVDARHLYDNCYRINVFVTDLSNPIVPSVKIGYTELVRI